MDDRLSRRALLTKAVYWMLALLALAFMFVLFRSISPSLSELGSSNESHQDTLLFGDVAPGQTVLRRVDSQRVWVTRFNNAQQGQAAQLADFVKDEGLHCNIDSQLCVLSAATARDGVELRYSRNAPEQLPSDILWLGGFVDPGNRYLYDLWGRAYIFQNIESLTEISIKP